MTIQKGSLTFIYGFHCGWGTGPGEIRMGWIHIMWAPGSVAHEMAQLRESLKRMSIYLGGLG